MDCHCTSVHDLEKAPAVRVQYGSRPDPLRTVWKCSSQAPCRTFPTMLDQYQYRHAGQDTDRLFLPLGAFDGKLCFGGRTAAIRQAHRHTRDHPRGIDRVFTPLPVRSLSHGCTCRNPDGDPVRNSGAADRGIYLQQTKNQLKESGP